MLTKDEIRRYLDNIQDEVDSSYLYRFLSKIETNRELSEIYLKLAESEESHASFWEEKLAECQISYPKRKPSMRARILARLSRRFGKEFLLEQLIGQEREGARNYNSQPESKGTVLPEEEASHQKILGDILVGNKNLAPSGHITGREKWHRAGGNTLRAAVMGSNDGLVSNLSLVMGVAGASLSSHSILITGMAGLLAGACSMAIGEWLSVQSSRELYANQIKIEMDEIKHNPEEEKEELALIYQAKGMEYGEAVKLAERIMENPESSADTLAREELGIDPEDLGGSAYTAAFTSFCLFAVGAVFPVIPFVFLNGTTAVYASLGLSCAALFLIGSAITLFTGMSVLVSGGRQILFGLLAAGITYSVGKIIGVSVS